MAANLYDFRDLDLMMRLAEANGEGISSVDLAGELGLDDDVRAVAVRAAWMRRFGMLEFDEKAKLWRLSPSGDRVVRAKRRAATIREIEAVPDESMLDVMSHVTARYRLGDPVLATLLRREFAFGTSPRSSVWGR